MSLLGERHDQTTDALRSFCCYHKTKAPADSVLLRETRAVKADETHPSQAPWHSTGGTPRAGRATKGTEVVGMPRRGTVPVPAKQSYTVSNTGREKIRETVIPQCNPGVLKARALLLSTSSEMLRQHFLEAVAQYRPLCRQRRVRGGKLCQATCSGEAAAPVPPAPARRQRHRQRSFASTRLYLAPLATT